MSTNPSSALSAIFTPVAGVVVIIESAPAIALDLEMTLRLHGAKDIIVAGTLREALRVVEQPSLAVVIMDSRFGGLAALVLAARFASLGVPILFLNADPTFEGAGALAGVAVIAKPHDDQDLVDGLRGLLKL